MVFMEDITGSTPAEHVLCRKNYDTDYLQEDFAEWATESFAPRDMVNRRQDSFHEALYKFARSKSKLFSAFRKHLSSGEGKKNFNNS